MSGGGTIGSGSQSLVTPPENPNQLPGAATPGAEESTVVVAPDPEGDNLLEVRGTLQGVCQASKNLKRVLIKGRFYAYKNAGDWLGNPEWVDPQPLSKCLVRVVFPQGNGLHFKDDQCVSLIGPDKPAMKGNVPANNFEMTLTTNDPHAIRVFLKSPHYPSPPMSDPHSCEGESCIQVGVYGVRNVMEYSDLENLPECVQSEITTMQPQK